MKTVTTVSTLWIAATPICLATAAFGQTACPQRPSDQSPASQPWPKSAAQQTYTAEQIREGEVRFAAQCGFCHGKDAAGGESGPDLDLSQ